MTDPQVDTPQVDKQSEKELNFRKQQQMYERMIAEKEARIADLERSRQPARVEDDDDDDEPYVDKRKLKKTLSSFEESLEKKIEMKAEQKARELMEAEKRSQYLRDNSDFDKVMGEENIQKFATKHQKLAESILRMPDGFERQRLVYETIKSLDMDRPENKQPSIQDKIDANRRGNSYQPSGMSSAPYAGPTGDFSQQGQKSAYDNMQKLKARLGGY
jgi:hypothetical protein